ncbi:hypothetical protein NDU88_004764 [Pleurodeles waltl]|uniref:Uncharacterized protein n=1 Tax=Pleurodeles waltl TaxID=8319 RepID=A0AAV7RMF6_PLEWA|nr:hypothetical protein NDU88_004764 [Pleurodeles waltl]
MRKLLVLCLAVLALAALLPTQIYCQGNTTTTAAAGSSGTGTTVGSGGTSMSSVTTPMYNTTTKGHGNLLHASSGLFVIVIATSLLYVS